MIVFLWFGFAGAWLLFAGPVYQAAVELREQAFNEEEEAAFRRFAEQHPMEHVSPWWWLLPPVAYILSRRRSRAWRDEVFHAMSQEHRERFLTFQNKATGWLIVGAGALAIAVDETANLIEGMEWSLWALVPMLLVPFALGVGYTAQRMSRTRLLEHLDDDAAEARRDKDPTHR